MAPVHAVEGHDQQPAIRAHYAKVALKRLRAMPGGISARVRGVLGEDVVKSVRQASALSWLPVRDTLEVADAIHDVLGEDGARQFWSELMFDSYDRGMLKPLTTLARDGMDKTAEDRSRGPRALLHMAPRAWELSARACGSIELVGLADGDPGDEGGGEGAGSDTSSGDLRLSSANLIEEIIRSRGFHCVFYGACKAMLDQFRTPGTVTVTRTDERLTYEVRMAK